MDFAVTRSYDRSGVALVRRGSLTATTVALAAAGCVDGFRGSNVQIDLSPGTPVQTAVGQQPGAGELPANAHLRLYAVDEFNGTQALFEIQRFEIHRIVDVQSPCFIDVPPNVPFPGLHVSQFAAAMAEATGITDIANPPPGTTEAQQIDAATAIKRMDNIALLGGPMAIKVVTSASESTYPPVDADCEGGGLPPPPCRDEASNARRLAICRAAWAADPNLFEGTDRILTAPLAGITFGFVVGLNPVTPAPIGGAQFFVDEALAGIEQYAIQVFVDGAPSGTVLFTGTPSHPTRGVTHVHLDSPLSPNLTAEMAVFENLDDDEVHF